jgi:hypothetical protein
MQGRRRVGLLPASSTEVVDLSEEDISGGWGFGMRRRGRSSSGTSKSNDKCANCSAAPFVLKAVENLYLRGYADGVGALAPNVAFEDPAVRPALERERGRDLDLDASASNEQPPDSPIHPGATGLLHYTAHHT